MMMHLQNAYHILLAVLSTFSVLTWRYAAPAFLLNDFGGHGRPRLVVSVALVRADPAFGLFAHR
jgi:hypothetical protein